MKSVAELRKGREGRAIILAEFGRVPESILRHEKSKKSRDLMAEERHYGSTSIVGNHTGVLGKVFSVSNTMQRGKGGTLSRFPWAVGRILLLFYTKKGDTVYDPFAGHNSRMELCFKHERNYFGCDLSAEFMEHNRKLSRMLRHDSRNSLLPNNAWVKLHEGDSRCLPMKSNIGDFTITSPPYWDLEYYGDEPQQLGAGSYARFLRGLGKVAKENFRVLKPGAFCVWCVNDFRKEGRFYSYHEDTSNLLRTAGFVQWDIAIVDLGSSIRAAFANQVIKSKILPKRHEYALIFRKPLTQSQ